MSGQNTQTPTPAAGQAANAYQQAANALGQQPEQQPASGQEQGQQQYVTMQEVTRLLDEKFSKAQSYTDKAKGQIEQKVEAIRKQMGGTLSQEQETALRANLAQEVQPSPASPTGQAPAQEQPQQGPVDPAIATAYKAMQKAGVTIEVNDPEFEKIAPFIGDDGSVSDPIGLFDAVKAGIADKQKRQAFKEKSPSRVPLGGGTPPAGQPVVNARQAWRDPNLFKK